MSGQVLKFDGSAHQATEALLPWFVNGTLEGAERVLVEQHLRECALCRREMDWLRELQAVEADGGMLTDASLSFQKLSRQLDEPGMAKRPVALLAGLRGFWHKLHPWVGWTVAVQSALILVLGVLLVSGRESGALYRTNGATRAMPAATAEMVVIFDSQTTEAQLRRIVRGAGARIVGGPTGTDGYVLELPAEHQSAALDALRKERAVLLVEPLGPGSAR